MSDSKLAAAIEQLCATWRRQNGCARFVAMMKSSRERRQPGDDFILWPSSGASMWMIFASERQHASELLLFDLFVAGAGEQEDDDLEMGVKDGLRRTNKLVSLSAAGSQLRSAEAAGESRRVGEKQSPRIACPSRVHANSATVCAPLTKFRPPPPLASRPPERSAARPCERASEKNRSPGWKIQSNRNCAWEEAGRKCP